VEVFLPVHTCPISPRVSLHLTNKESHKQRHETRVKAVAGKVTNLKREGGETA